MQDFRQQHLGGYKLILSDLMMSFDQKIPKTDLRIFWCILLCHFFQNSNLEKKQISSGKNWEPAYTRPPKKTSTFSNDWKTPYHQSKPLVFCQLICGFLCPKSPPLKHLMRWGRLHSHLFEMCIATANVTSKSRRAAKTDCGNWRKCGEDIRENHRLDV